MRNVKGTEGYKDFVEQFIKGTKEIDFNELHKPFLNFIPQKPNKILDVGAGIGRDSFKFSEMGHLVTAVEPLQDFIDTARKLYDSPRIEWINDSLPQLKKLKDQENQFGFILASSVWHHLNNEEQKLAIVRISRLLSPKSVFALSLRHGPAGVGTHIFPTSGENTIKSATSAGLKLILNLAHQPSMMRHKKHVFWTKLAFQKP